MAQYGIPTTAVSSAQDVQWKDQYNQPWYGSVTGYNERQASNVAMAEMDRRFQSSQAQRAMDFEKEMSSSAYQRAMADMKKAGLNPAMLMKSAGGQPASTAQGAQGGGARGSVAPSGLGELAGVIGAIAFSSAKAVATVKSGLTKKAVLKSHGIRI